MTTYYVDSAAGNDSNNGQSPNSAWSSISKVDAASLKPGDEVLFMRGDTFNGTINVTHSGTSTSPIIFGAYGTGANPIITGGQNGITSTGSSFVTVQDLQIQNTSGQAINLHNGANNWTFNDVDTANTAGGFWLVNVNNAVIENSHVHSGSAEGVWGWNVNGLTVQNTFIDPLTGTNTDGMQFTGVSNYTLVNDTINMTGTNSIKGDFNTEANNHLGNPGTNIVENSVFIGGNFGISSGDSNLTIKNNEFLNHNSSSWSSDVMVSESGSSLAVNSDVQNVVISNNLMENSSNGVQLWGTGTRENIQVDGNVIENAVHAVNQNGTAIYSNLSISENTIWTSGHGAAPSSPLTGSIGATASTASTSPSVQTILAEIAGLPQPDVTQLAILSATGPNQTVTGSGPDVALLGVANGDTLVSQGNFTILAAGSGTETLLGASGTNEFIGGSGADRIVPGSGTGYIETGSGADMIAIKTASAGNVDVYGFNAALDHFQVTSSTATASSLVHHATSDAQGDAVIHYGSHEMVLHGIPVSHLSADWFTIVH